MTITITAAAAVLAFTIVMATAALLATPQVVQAGQPTRYCAQTTNEPISRGVTHSCTNSKEACELLIEPFALSQCHREGGKPVN